MLIYNPRPEVVTVQVCGKYFEFKPEQVKLIHNDNFARMLVTDKWAEGLVSVPDVVVEAPTSEEAISIKLEAKKQGIANRVKFLERVKYNLMVSLQNDLDAKNLKIDALKMATPGDKKALKELAMYTDMRNNEQEQEYEDTKRLVEKLDGKSGKPDSTEIVDRGKDISKPKGSNK